MRKLPASLQNTYYLMRHAESIPNVEGLIVSHTENGTQEKYGLSDHGREQAKQAATRSNLPADTLIYTSDFSRTRQTAEIVAQAIGAPAPILATELRERCFGELELGPSTKYHDVWCADVAGQDYGRGVESLAEVSDRVLRLIEGIEQVHRNKTILLVSHGDTLQVAQAAARHLHPALQYNKVRYLSNAEIVPLMMSVVAG